MSKIFRMLTLTLWFCGLAAVAQPQSGVLIMPMEMPDHYTAADSEELTKKLEQEIHKMAPKAKLTLARAADLTAYGYQAGDEQPPSLELAEKLSRAYGVADVAWISIHFQPDYHPETGSLALAGAVRFWDYNARARRVDFDETFSLVRVGQVPANASEEKVSAQAHELAAGCMGDLAYQLVGLARQRVVAPPVAAASWSAPKSDPTQSKNYRAMIKATQDYQRAVRAQSVVDITTSQAAMSRAWAQLNQGERDAIAQNYPDLKKAMDQVPVYQYGGYYYGTWNPVWR